MLDLIEPLNLLARDFQRAVQFLALRFRHLAELALHELEMDVQRVERIPDLMRDARREQREGGQLLGLDRFLRRTPRFRDVTQDHRITDELLLDRLRPFCRWRFDA